MKRQSQSNETARDELRRIAPDLPEHPHQDGFRVPHQYFELTPDRIMARIKEEGMRKTERRWWQYLLQTQFALSLAVVAIVLVVLFRTAPQTHETDLLAGITEEEAMQYVLANLDAYSTEDLIPSDARWEEADFIQISDENADEMIDELLENSDPYFIEELF